MARGRRPGERRRILRGLCSRLDFEGLWGRYVGRVGGVGKPDLTWEEFLGLLGEVYLEGAYMGATRGRVEDWELEGMGLWLDRFGLGVVVSRLERERRREWERELLETPLFDG